MDGKKVLQMEIGNTGMVVDVPMVEHGLDLQGELMVNTLEGAEGEEH